VEFTLGPTQQAVVEAAAHVLDGYQPGRAARGEAEYLAVCPPSGQPVALGGIGYVKISGAGVLWQLAVHEALQSCGIGTILIQAAEQRIRSRGLRWAELGVEECNPRARAVRAGSAMLPTAVRPSHGTRMPRTGPSSGTRPSAH
jgi:ribosomal protein S18 acetylase RimI-like enzyme